MKIYWFWAGLLLLSGTITAQERLLFNHSCNYTGEISPVEDLYGFASDSEAEDAMRRIMRYTGLPANFTIKAANVPNAAAVLQQEQRYILYNQYFMLRIKDQTQTDWAALSILAHEIGHHLSGHTLDNQGSRPDKELEADRFSGFILYKMGASLEEARAAMDALASETGTSTHPPKSARLAALTNGWLEAQQQNEDVKPIVTKGDTPPKPPVRPPVDPQKAQTTFRKIWLEQDVEEGGAKGVRLHARFNVSNLFGQNCRAVVWFYDAQSNLPLKDRNGRYATSAGDVSTGVDFVPNYLSTDFTDFPIFIPYEELHLAEGSHQIKFQIGVFHRLPGGQLQQVGSASPFQTFEYGTPEAAPTTGLREIWLEENVSEGLQTGIRIHLEVQFDHFPEQPCRAVAWFFYDNGRPLLDYNGRYCTSDGKVSAGTDFYLPPNGSGLQDITIFIPYDELHLSGGEHALKWEAGLFLQGKGGYEPLGNRFTGQTFMYTR